ncbi:MAG: hypothetical protein CMG74_08665 [Candidatus Marinimicrobia bacterium]|nr:hypothetical protein [Candidatus Neomarinimicrobiota bacterium]|tara:strand:- start:35304 stop:36194 length:891 start_codon:yes stop_codon:yes gene_type:complete
MSTITPAKPIIGILVGILLSSSIKAQNKIPFLIQDLRIKEKDKGLNIEFIFSDAIGNNDISGWIDREKWLTLNLYNIKPPEKDFFSSYISYPIQEIQNSMSVDAVQISIHLTQPLKSFDIIRHINSNEVLISILYDQGNYDGESAEIKQSFVFPDPKSSQKKQHPLSWKDQRIRSSIRILCDTPGIPIYVDDKMVGHSPLDFGVDVLPGWHKVGYFPENPAKMSKVRTPNEKLVNDIMRMGLMDVFVDEGDEATVVLNYQSLEGEVFDYNEKTRTQSYFGFGIFFLVILLLSWGMA